MMGKIDDFKHGKFQINLKNKFCVNIDGDQIFPCDGQVSHGNTNNEPYWENVGDKLAKTKLGMLELATIYTFLPRLNTQHIHDHSIRRDGKVVDIVRGKTGISRRKINLAKFNAKYASNHFTKNSRFFIPNRTEINLINCILSQKFGSAKYVWYILRTIRGRLTDDILKVSRSGNIRKIMDKAERVLDFEDFNIFKKYVDIARKDLSAPLVRSHNMRFGFNTYFDCQNKYTRFFVCEWVKNVLRSTVLPEIRTKGSITIVINRVKGKSLCDLLGKKHEKSKECTCANDPILDTHNKHWADGHLFTSVSRIFEDMDPFTRVCSCDFGHFQHRENCKLYDRNLYSRKKVRAWDDYFPINKKFFMIILKYVKI